MSRALPSGLRAIRRLPPTSTPLPRPTYRPTPAARPFTTRSALRYKYEPLGSLEQLSPEHQEALALAALTKRRNRAAIGFALCMVATGGLIAASDIDISGGGNKPDKTDAGDRTFPSPATAPAATAEDEKLRGLRATGTSHVPFFPKTLVLESSSFSTAPATTATPALPAGVGAATATNNDEFTLLGLGVRTVSFLSIQVYVVGLYVATADLPLLQKAMIREGADTPAASTLVAGEKARLKERLLDASGDEGLLVWNRVLRDAGIRSAVRVVPTRNTDHSHLRDSWVRGIMARSGNATSNPVTGEKFDDDAFGEAVGQFKRMFGSRKLAKGRVLLLEREKNGALVGWEQQGEKEEDVVKMGEVADERLGRLIWQGYLAGKTVSSEDARKDIVNYVLDLVERPIGTVETQVV